MDPGLRVAGDVKSSRSDSISSLTTTFTIKPAEREEGYRVVVDQRVAEFTRHDKYNQKQLLQLEFNFF